MFTKKTAPVRFFITILLLTMILTSIPFISAEPVEAADYSKAVVDAYRKGNDSFPKINLLGANFDKVNKEIWNKFYNRIISKSEYSDYRVSYVWGRKDNVLSVVINQHMVNQANDNTLYNLKLPNGEVLNKKQVLAAAGISEDKFYEKVKQALGSHYKTEVWKNDNFYIPNQVNLYNNGLSETLSIRNIESSQPFFNEKGELCFIGTIIGPPAGSTEYEVRLNLENFKVAKDYDKKASLQAYPVNISRTEADQIALKSNGMSSRTVPTYKQGTKDFSYLFMAKGTNTFDNEAYSNSRSRYFYDYEKFYVYVMPALLSSGTSHYAVVDANTGEARWYNLSVWNYVEKINDLTQATISGITAKSYTGSAITQSGLTVKYNGKTLRQGTDYTVAYKNNTNVGTATVEVTGMGDYGGKITKTFKITAKMPAGATRVYGSNRFDTSTKIADSIKSLNGNKKFSSIIVATGTNYPDALSGSYLAKVKNAPIILTNKSNETTTVNYIKSNLSSGGTVYILGGQGAVSADFSNKLFYAGINRVRLGGTDRLDTNLKVLNTAGNFGDELIVVTGWNYPDALSASAIGKPILLVGKSLTKSQKDFLKSKKFKKITVIGGTSAVSQSVANELGVYGTVNRVAGKNRYDTSAQIARKYFSKATDVVLATGKNYPDALSGGPLAIKKKAPLILTSNVSSEYTYARSYISSAKIKKSTVIGGEGLINNGTMTALMK